MAVVCELVGLNSLGSNQPGRRVASRPLNDQRSEDEDEDDDRIIEEGGRKRKREWAKQEQLNLGILEGVEEGERERGSRHKQKMLLCIIIDTIGSADFGARLKAPLFCSILFCSVLFCSALSRPVFSGCVGLH